MQDQEQMQGHLVFCPTHPIPWQGPVWPHAARWAISGPNPCPQVAAGTALVMVQPFLCCNAAFLGPGEVCHACCCLLQGWLCYGMVCFAPEWPALAVVRPALVQHGRLARCVDPFVEEVLSPYGSPRSWYGFLRGCAAFFWSQHGLFRWRLVSPGVARLVVARLALLQHGLLRWRRSFGCVAWVAWLSFCSGTTYFVVAKLAPSQYG
mmetsp:Transcript_251/g.675  ORF Transcript_251/g.675 Transcript_251/m.675 type:complete len:207 (+) Transcript_251:47-667(+)